MSYLFSTFYWSLLRSCNSLPCLSVFLFGFLMLSHVGAVDREFDPAEVALVRDGQLRSVIVRASSESQHERRMLNSATEVLAEGIERMTGKRPEVVGEDQLLDLRWEKDRLEARVANVDHPVDAFLLVGDGLWMDGSPFASAELGPGGLQIERAGNTVLLTGTPDGFAWRGGALYAAFRFLEELGFRYLWPGQSGMVIPSADTVLLEDWKISHTPKIQSRSIRFIPEGPRRYESGLELLELTREDRGSAKEEGDYFHFPQRTGWSGWQLLGGSYPSFGHAGGGLRGGWEEWGDQHPEWFALQADGSRAQDTGRYRLCKSNPELIAHVADDIIRQRNEDPDLILVSLDGNDGGYASDCLCDACQALDPPEGPTINRLIFERGGSAQRESIEYPSLTDRYLHYWNSIAKRVTEAHPDLLFGVSAYRVHSHPPVKGRLHPNLVLRYVPSNPERLTGWRDAGVEQFIWRPNFLHNGFAEGTLNHHRARELASLMNDFSDNGMVATDIQGIYHNWATQGLTYYVAARSNWDPELDYDILLEDYTRHGFGPAAAPVKSYFLEAEGLGNLTEISREQIQSLRGHLREARGLAADDPAVQERIDFLALGLELTALTSRIEQLAEQAQGKPDEVDRNAAIDLIERRRALMRHIYRTHPMAVNVALVEGNNHRSHRAWQSAFGWSPNELPRDISKQQLDDWLYEDQTDWVE